MSAGVAISSLAGGVILNQITVEARGQLVSVLQPAEGVSVTVYVHEPGYVPTPQSTQAYVYQDELLTVPAAQPLTTDVDGNVPCYVATGQVLDLLCAGGPLPVPQVLTINTGFGGTLTAPLLVVGLPIANPHVAGQVWSNAGVLTLSAG